MLTKKSQMLASLAISNEQEVLWLMQWNKSNVFREAKKFPKQGFSNFMFDKWLHKATFCLKYLFLQILHFFNCKFLAKFEGFTIEVYSYVTWSWSSKVVCIDNHGSCLVCWRYKQLIFLVGLHKGMEAYNMGDYIL